MKRIKMKRRGVLGALAATGGGALLQSLATGIPAKVLLDPLSARADEPTGGRVVIMSSSTLGDPVNANVPGTYAADDPSLNEIYHPADVAMQPTQISLSGQQWTAAAPWAGLGPAILDKTVFFHHATYTPVHGELARVQRMMDGTEKNDMLVSLIARELAEPMQAVQADPISLGAQGGELLTSGGRILGNVAPLSVRQALGGVDGPLMGLESLRDESIDAIYALYKENGTKAQQRLLDDWVRSRDEVRGISTELVSRLDAIDGNDQRNQVLCAAVLAAMNIAPVITIHLDFGRDNHNDNDFVIETERHQSALADVALLVSELDQLQLEGALQHDYLIASLNVFGRTLKKKGMNGRDHNSGHHCMWMIGSNLKGGVIGGLTPEGPNGEYIAKPINSATGAGEAGGDIGYDETLGSMGKTLAVAAGVSAERADEMIDSGKVVAAAFV